MQLVNIMDFLDSSCYCYKIVSSSSCLYYVTKKFISLYWGKIFFIHLLVVSAFISFI